MLMNLRFIYKELSPHVMKGDNTLYGTNVWNGEEFVYGPNVHGDEFVWDEFVGD